MERRLNARFLDGGCCCGCPAGQNGDVMLTRLALLFGDKMSNDFCNWNNLAQDWDAKMGDNSNRWHRELILPKTIELLELKADDIVFEIGCGNGGFANTISEMCNFIIATDFSSEMIRLARQRWENNKTIEFHVADATKYDELVSIGKSNSINKVVSNMAIMDISNIQPMFLAAGKILNEDGLLVFSSIHPCFQNPGMVKIVEIDDNSEHIETKKGIKVFNYIEPKETTTRILANNNLTATHYHRPINMIIKILKDCGFVVDIIEEPVFAKKESNEFDWDSIPPVIIYRARKIPDNRRMP